MLSYIRQDAEVHDSSEHDDDDEYCPTKLYERGQAVYDDSRLLALMRGCTGPAGGPDAGTGALRMATG